MENTNKRAVIYARYSCEKQNEQSIEGQLRTCHEFAERNGYAVVDDYIDRAASGTTDHRKHFQEMLRDSAKHIFDYVIVYKLDRFARNRYDSAMNKALLKKNGVKVLSACEQITDSPEGIILEAMIEGYAEYYSVELGQKVRRGIRESSLKGQYTGGAVLFGYKVSDKKIYIEESEATIVRKIFEDYNNGKAIKGIRNWLNESGIRMHGGGKFTFGRVSSMLHNEKYIGRCVIQGEEYLNIYPPILDKELFETVQERLSKNAHINRFRAKKEFLLTGKLYCACCGNLITGDGGTSHTGAKYMYYKCASKKRDTRSCPSKGIRKEFLEESVYDKILETLREPGLSERLSREVTEIYNAGIEENEELKILRKQLNETDKKINNLTEAVCNGFYNKQSQEKMVELNQTRDKLVTEIAKEESKERKQLSEEEVEKFLLRYRRYTDGSEESKKRLIETFVKEVIFDGVNVLIVLRTVNSTDAAKELKANSLVNPRGRAGKGDGERFYLKSERISQKNESQTEKRFSLALSGDLTENRIEPRELGTWRYFCLKTGIKCSIAS